jgi:hypothetical protein
VREREAKRGTVGVAWYGGGSSAGSCVSESRGGSLEKVWGEGA